jgi:hypothetical protein
VEIERPPLAVDQHRGGCEALAQRPAHQIGRGGLVRLGRIVPRRALGCRGLPRAPQNRKIDDVVSRRPEPAEDAPFRRERLEELLVASHGLRAAEKERAALAQREMHQADDPLLRLRLQVDHQVAAGDDIEPRERRVAQKVVRGEDNQFAQRLVNLVGAVELGEEPPAPLGAERFEGRLGIDALAGDPEALRLAVGGEDLQVERLARRVGLLRHQHREGVCLLARGAARDPHADRRAIVALGGERRQHAGDQRLPCLGVAQEAGDGDHQVAGERGRLGRLGAQELDIILERIDPSQSHAPVDAPGERAALVLAEIAAFARPKQGDDRIELVAAPPVAAHDAIGIGEVAVPAEAHEHLGHRAGIEHVIRMPRVDRAARHPVEARRPRVLHQRAAARALHHLQAMGAVGAGAREDDGDRALLALFRKRREENVHRTALATRHLRLAQAQVAVTHFERGVRRDHVDPVALDRHAVLDLEHGHRRPLRQDMRKLALLGRVEMKHGHEGHAAVWPSRRRPRIPSMPARYIQPAAPVYQVQPPRPTWGGTE